MQRSELPTEPEIPLGPEHRDAALELWLEHHHIPQPLPELLRMVVHGQGTKVTARELGVTPGEVRTLERDFQELMGQSIFEVATSILSAALERGRQREQVQI